MEPSYVARVPGGLCYQTHAEAMLEAGRIKGLSMLLEVRGYWIVLTRETLLESVAAIDAVEAASLAASKLIDEAKAATAAAAPQVVEDDPATPVKLKDRKNG